MQTAGGRPVTDVDHHVVYSDPKYSLAKTIALLRRYYLDLGHTTALSIAETWAPWCDTNGSKLYHLGWGRTCHDGVGAAPASFTGPRCLKPAEGVPLRGQCGPCNCPNELAEFYVKDSGKRAHDELDLFDAQGKPTPALNPVLRRVVRMELGYWPNHDLIDAAVTAYKP